MITEKYPFLFYGTRPKIKSHTLPTIAKSGNVISYEIKFAKIPSKSLKKRIHKVINFELSCSPIKIANLIGWKNWLYIDLASSNYNLDITKVISSFASIWQEALIKVNTVLKIKEVRCLPCVHLNSKWDKWTIKKQSSPSASPDWPKPQSKIAIKNSCFGANIEFLSNNSIGKKTKRFPLTANCLWKYKDFEYDIVKDKGNKRILILENAYSFKFSRPTKSLLHDLPEDILYNDTTWNSCCDVQNLISTIYPVKGKSIFDSLIEQLHLHIYKYQKEYYYLSNYDYLLGFFSNTVFIGIPYRHELVLIYPILNKKPYYLYQESKFYRLKSEYIYEIINSDILKTNAFSKPKFTSLFHNSDWIRFLLCFPEEKYIKKWIKDQAVFLRNENKEFNKNFSQIKKSKGSAQFLY